MYISADAPSEEGEEAPRRTSPLLTDRNSVALHTGLEDKSAGITPTHLPYKEAGTGNGDVVHGHYIGLRSERSSDAPSSSDIVLETHS